MPGTRRLALPFSNWPVRLTAASVTDLLVVDILEYLVTS
jgi:hypothetical protein